MGRKKKIVGELLTVDKATKIVENYLGVARDSNIDDDKFQFMNAVDTILNEYSKLEKENEELKHQNICLNDELILARNGMIIGNVNILDDTFDELKNKKPQNKPADLELGDIMFNTNHQQIYVCPKYVVALLSEISRMLDIVMHNKGMTYNDYDSPFSNTGNSYKNDVFEVQAYSWDDEHRQDYNFKWRDVEISWYKYLGRDTTINGEYSYQYMIMMFDKCMASLRKINEELLKYN